MSSPTPTPAAPAAPLAGPMVPLRRYQAAVFWSDAKTLIMHWSRQIGKSYTLAAWAIDRLILFPGRLVTVLSNSRDNGAEFVVKAREVCLRLGAAIETEDASASLSYDDMRFEIRITVGGKTGRIKVLAANPRTARGFSGDLILDEFAFHEDSRAIWEAAEPIISSNPDFLCRIASTGNGRQNMFYQLISDGRIPYHRTRRSDAWAAGELTIYSAITGKAITPDQARAEASDKRAYDQNYECTFEDENSALLTHELISAAMRDTGWLPDHQAWSISSIARMHRAEGVLHAGWDFARTRDLSVITVLESVGTTRRQIAELIMEGLPTPEQNRQASVLTQLRNFRRLEIDMTGSGTGAYDYAVEAHGEGLIGGVNFSSTEPVTARIQAEGRKAPTAKVTEIMATDLRGVFEDRTIEIFNDPALRDDLRKPEKIVSPGGRVSIAAARTPEGHADRFWALALAVRASYANAEPGTFRPMPRLLKQVVEGMGHFFAGTQPGRHERRAAARNTGL